MSDLLFVVKRIERAKFGSQSRRTKFRCLSVDGYVELVSCKRNALECYCFESRDFFIQDQRTDPQLRQEVQEENLLLLLAIEGI